MEAFLLFHCSISNGSTAKAKTTPLITNPNITESIVAHKGVINPNSPVGASYLSDGGFSEPYPVAYTPSLPTEGEPKEGQ